MLAHLPTMGRSFGTDYLVTLKFLIGKFWKSQFIIFRHYSYSRLRPFLLGIFFSLSYSFRLVYSLMSCKWNFCQRFAAVGNKSPLLKCNCPLGQFIDFLGRRKHIWLLWFKTKKICTRSNANFTLALKYDCRSKQGHAKFSGGI